MKRSRCQHGNTSRSRRRGIHETLAAYFGFLPYRCHDCGARVLLRSTRINSPPSARARTLPSDSAQAVFDDAESETNLAIEQQILERLLRKHPRPAQLTNFDDLGSDDILGQVLRKLKKQGIITYSAQPQNGWEGLNSEQHITDIQLTSMGKQKASEVISQPAEKSHHPERSA